MTLTQPLFPHVISLSALDTSNLVDKKSETSSNRNWSTCNENQKELRLRNNTLLLITKYMKRSTYSSDVIIFIKQFTTINIYNSSLIQKILLRNQTEQGIYESAQR